VAAHDLYSFNIIADYAVPKRCHECRLVKRLYALSNHTNGSEQEKPKKRFEQLHIEFLRHRIHDGQRPGQTETEPECKTQASCCYSWQNTGFCRYGMQCRFKHTGTTKLPSSSCEEEYLNENQDPNTEHLECHIISDANIQDNFCVNNNKGQRRRQMSKKHSNYDKTIVAYNHAEPLQVYMSYKFVIIT
jgi:hypothetical protein